ncbi:beta/alpha barrel domain-containing protein [Flavobacterium seoulense]|uniref:Hydrolase n=1 Tax=Flavobacterium seoulense TaxID=1492738 RepID=A0A066WNZ1_9FLAO|nr:hypothetical protein [Flavobacterium seoulense]KDN54303.1 hypothetical protein FEM21_25540 [Flavobacterium seoulense]
MQINSDFFWGIKKKIPFWERFFGKKTINKALNTPEIISKRCKGITMGEENLKSFLFSTDMALIENNDADAILAVYPFPPSPKIIKTLIDFSEKPVICGVGGGVTKGKKSLEMAIYAQEIGAAGIIVNIPFENKDLKKIREKVTLPIIASVATADYNFLKNRIDAGTTIFHVTGGIYTNAIVQDIATKFPGFPIMATGGKSLSSIEESIEAGAMAIVLSPPSNKDLFKNVMTKYRNSFGLF